MNVAEFSVRHSVFGNMLTLVVLIAGIVIVSDMKREVFPEISLDVVTIATVYPNASPVEVEELITARVEDAIREVDGINEYTSSSIEGVSLVVVEVDPEAKNKERVFNDIQRKVDQIADFPAEAQDPVIKILTTQGPIINVSVGGDAPESALRAYADYFKSRLEQIPDIASVQRSGWRDEEFWVELDPVRLDDYELSVLEVSRALALRNINLPGGKLRTPDRERVLRSIGQFHTAEDIEAVIVRSNPDGHSVAVRDVGTVTRTFEEDTIYTRANGHRAIILGVKKKERADTIRAVDAVKQLVEQERERLPEGLYLSLTDDESFYVKRRLYVLSMNGLLGMVFVLGCLFLFLNFRVALITAIGIPFSFLAAFLMMKLYGVTINLMTMFGLIIVLGMVVDDAIIVGENIFRHLEMGKSPRAAAIEGTQEVMYPVITTVLTTCAAFLPLMFAPDIYADFLKWLPIVVLMTLAASLFESLVILPCHAADFVPPFKQKDADSGGRHHAHRWMAATVRVYARALERALRFRYAFLALVLAAFMGMGAWSFKTMRIDIFPADLIDVFFVRMTLEEGASLERTGEAVEQAERIITALPPSELSDVIAHVGGHFDVFGGYTARGSQFGSLAVHCTPQNERDRKTRAIIDSLRADIAAIPDVVNVEFEMISPGPPVGRPLEVKIIGRNFAVLRQVAEEIQAYLHTLEGVLDIADDFDAGKEEVHVRIDYAEAARLGLDMAAVAQAISSSFQGSESTIVREGKEEVTVRVRLTEPYRNDPSMVGRIRITNAQGRLIPLSLITRVEQTQGLPTIYHYMGERVITVSADVDTRVTSSVEANQAVLNRFGDLHVAQPGYRLVLSGEWEETAKLLSFVKTAFTIAVLVIFAILVVQFNSFVQPFVVIVSIPLGLIGVTLALIVHDKPISIMAMMGMVGLAGVAVNDAIVLVNFINHKRREGVLVHAAVQEAGEKRLRPILLTTVTTITGLLPVIYGWGGYEPFIAPAAITLGYGLLFASFLTLFVVPCLYYVADDWHRVVRREQADTDK